MHTVLRSQCPIVVCPVESPPNGIVLLFVVVVVVIVGATLGSGSQIPPRLSCVLIVVSDRARPLSDEGSRIPRLCWPRSCWRWREMYAASAILCRQPSSSTLGSTASALPPLARRDVQSWAIALRGHHSPLPLCAASVALRRWGCTMEQSVARWAVFWKEYARGRRRPVDGVGWIGGGGRW